MRNPALTSSGEADASRDIHDLGAEDLRRPRRPRADVDHPPEHDQPPALHHPSAGVDHPSAHVLWHGRHLPHAEIDHPSEHDLPRAEHLPRTDNNESALGRGLVDLWPTPTTMVASAPSRVAATRASQMLETVRR